MITKRSVFLLAIAGFFIASTCHATDAAFNGWDKLDLRAKQFVENKSNEGKTAEIIIKTTKPVRHAQKKTFKKVGFEYKSIINNIVTGSIAWNKLKALANVKFVERIELAVPVGPK
jgi:hypothetical protein